MNDMVEVVEVTQADWDTAKKLASYAGFSWSADHLDMAISEAALAFARHRIAHSPGDGVVVAARFLCDRLNQLEWNDGDLVATMRDYFGHVGPAVERLEAMIAAAGQGD